MSLVEELKIVEHHKKALDNSVADIIRKLSDASIPLSERWEAYTHLVNTKALVKNEIFGDGYIDDLGEGLTLYNEFYIERHETRDFIDMYEHIMDNIDNFEEENIHIWQEKVLQSGYSSFTYDW